MTDLLLDDSLVPPGLSPGDESVSDFISPPGASEVTVRWEIITPEVAEQYLGWLPEMQRTRSGARTQEYRLDMTEGRWRLTGDPVRFNRKGELADGHHRLRACVESGVAFVALVIRGLDEDVFWALDQGLPRTMAHMLQAQFNTTNATAEGALLTALWHWQHGNYGVKHISPMEYPQHLNKKPPREEMAEIFKEHRNEIAEALRVSNRIIQKPDWAKGSITRTNLALVYFVLRKIDYALAGEFFWALEDGERRVDAKYEVIRWVVKSLAKYGDRPNSENFRLAAIVFKGWNAFVNGTRTGGYFTPPSAPWTALPLPVDPHADERPEGWTVL